MSRIEVLGLFKAIQLLGQKKDLDSIMELVNTVVEEAKLKPDKRREYDE